MRSGFGFHRTDVAIEHFKNFLSAFQTSPQVENNPMEVEFLGENAKELQQIFKESFKAISIENYERKSADCRASRKSGQLEFKEGNDFSVPSYDSLGPPFFRLQ